MSERTGACDRIVQSLLLFYLFERFCAGFMKWGLEPSGTDSKFRAYLLDRLNKLDKKGGIKDDHGRYGAEKSPFDTGLIASDLAEYFGDLWRKSAEERPFDSGNVKPQAVFEEMQGLLHMRNKVMHGLSAHKTPEEIARNVVWLMNQIAESLGSKLSQFSPLSTGTKGVDHTIWARLLFLTEGELLSIAHGRQLPVCASRPPVFSVRFGPKDADRASFRMTERHRRMSKVKSPLYLNGELIGCSTAWVSSAPIPIDQIEESKARIRQRTRDIVDPGLPISKIVISAIPEGMTDVESDSFCIPWWKTAPKGEQYIWIAIC